MTFRLPAEGSDVTVSDLRRLTTELIDEVQRLLRRCVDADVVFVPVDPQAHDAAASSRDEAAVAWTLGHILVHMTASSEESAALAAELARGIPYHGRSRSEVPWQAMTTVVQCYARLEESRRMRLASLGMWPGSPHLDNVYVPLEGAQAMGPFERFLSGLKHDADHLDQVRDVASQARTFRKQKTLLGRWRRWWTAHVGNGATPEAVAGRFPQNSGLL
ncbi:MAG TPA: DinB family protein [Ktedonobacterales bacterium]|nr:DinB family protein [Ktedonobacterales bacterium]